MEKDLVVKRAKILEIKKEIAWIGSEFSRIEKVEEYNFKKKQSILKIIHKEDKLHISFLHVRLNEIIEEIRQIGVRNFDKNYIDMINDLCEELSKFDDEKYHIRPAEYNILCEPIIEK